MNASAIGIAKNVFQLRSANRDCLCIFSRREMHVQFLGVIAQIELCTIGIESYISAFGYAKVAKSKSCPRNQNI